MGIESSFYLTINLANLVKFMIIMPDFFLEYALQYLWLYK